MDEINVDLSVIVPTHNRADALELTLQKLAAQKFDGNWEVIVVNNNCTDNTDEVVKCQDFPVDLQLVYQSIPGASATRNAGARVAKGKYLIFIDNDILCEPDLLEKHFKALQQNPGFWIVGQVINLEEQEKSVFGKYRKTLFPLVPETDAPHEINGLTGQNVSMPRSDFEKLGGFDESFYVASGEDQEFSMRARKQLGVKVLLVPSIMVIHNDWAGWSFEDFCARQSKYAQTEFLFWTKYGDEHPRLQLVKENLPLDWKEDSYLLILRKTAKKGLGSLPVQTVLLKFSNLIEKIFPFEPVLWRLYKLTLAGAIHRGFEVGRMKSNKSSELSSQNIGNKPKT